MEKKIHNQNTTDREHFLVAKAKDGK